MVKAKNKSTINELTETKEDYLRAIFVLQHRYNRFPKVNDIAQYLEIKKTTVSEALKSLSDEGFVVKENYKPISLTSEGLTIAKNLTWKHRLIEVFLYRMLGVDINQVHNEAHKLEHAFSDDVMDRLYAFLSDPDSSIQLFNDLKESGKILTCPHGQPLK